MISLKTHNVLDYVIGALLLLGPSFFGFTDITAARNVFWISGVGLIGYSLVTRYRYSVAKLIPLGVHMALDVAAGIFLMLAPALFDYSSFLTGGQYALHYVYGFGAIGLVALTRPRSEQEMFSSDIDRIDGDDKIDRDFPKAA